LLISGIFIGAAMANTLTNNPIRYASQISGFYGEYKGTAYYIGQPCSDNYIQSYLDGGTIQTYYGVFNDTSLQQSSDEQFSGSVNGVKEEVQLLGTQLYYDSQNVPISMSLRQITTIGNQIQSQSLLHEYGNYQGHFNNEVDFLAGSIGQQFTNAYEQRNYVNGNYNDTSQISHQITIIDFPTKIMEAGTFATVHIEDIQTTNGIQNTKTESYISKNNGQTIYSETYQYNQNSWNLIVTRELISLSQPSLSPSPTVEPSPSASPVPIVESFASNNLVIISLVVIVVIASISLVYFKRRKSKANK
jgi:hypothetical protein